MAKATRDATIAMRFEFQDYRHKMTVTSARSEKKSRVYGYAIGDTISGQLVIDCIQEQPIDLVKIQLVGVGWHKKAPVEPDIATIVVMNTEHRRATVVYKREDNLLDATRLVDYHRRLGKDNPFDLQGNLKAQTHSIPFQYTLAAQPGKLPLPASYEDAYYKVVYVAFVTLERPDGKKPLFLLQTLNVFSAPSMEAIQLNNTPFQTTKTVSTAKFGTATAHLAIPKLLWEVNGTIPIHIQVDNRLVNPIQSVEVSLVRSISYTDLNKITIGRREVILHHTDLCTVLPGKERQEVVVLFKVSANAKVFHILPLERADDGKKKGAASDASLSDSLDSNDSLSSSGVPGSSYTRHPFAEFDTSMYTQLQLEKTIAVAHRLVISINAGPGMWLEEQWKRESAQLQRNARSRQPGILKMAAAAMNAVRSGSKHKIKPISIEFEVPVSLYDKRLSREGRNGSSRSGAQQAAARPVDSRPSTPTAAPARAAAPVISAAHAREVSRPPVASGAAARTPHPEPTDAAAADAPISSRIVFDDGDNDSDVSDEELSPGMVDSQRFKADAEPPVDAAVPRRPALQHQSSTSSRGPAPNGGHEFISERIITSSAFG